MNYIIPNDKKGINMKKLFFTLLLTVSALYAISAQNIYKASYAMPRTNQAVNDNAQIKNKRIQMQIRRIKDIKCGDGKCGSSMKKSNPKCGTVHIETH